ncbi:DUF1150 family protein [Methylobacterium sp. sgz302541]|uniref:BQ00720 family protein n=1 Tax=unclassified Methylobacterium TaxID=2615210 RepID=UPI003D3454BF
MTQHDTTPRIEISTTELAALGEGHIAYVRPIRSEEVKALFPQAPDVTPGMDLFALLSANGTPILLADSRDVIVANAVANDLHTVSLH